jgi:AraC family transcriptional regulator
MRARESSEDRIQEVIPLLIDVQGNLDRDISLSSLARRYGYSPFHFHRFFSRAVGETPKQHIDRLRLERAAYKLAITAETVLGIALSVGFRNHETFSRAFKRAFGCAPRDYRRACRAAQRERMVRKRGFRGDGCVLSDVRFVSLPSATFLAIRRYGGYAGCPMPFSEGDSFWNDLVNWANRKKIRHQPLAIAISYDDPTITPDSLQRLDACIPADGDVPTDGRVRRLDFKGGAYGGIVHTGPLSTIDQAYRTLADGIRRSGRYVFDVGPPVQIYRKICIGGDPTANLMEVFFPVRAAEPANPSRRRKIRQDRTTAPA